MKEFNKFSSSCVTIKTKSSIKGTISPVQDFIFVNKNVIDNGEFFVNERNTVDAFLPIDSDIISNFDYNIFVSSEGAVCDAYDLSCYTEEQIGKIKADILKAKQIIYPKYNFSIKEGVFPLNINGSNTNNGNVESGITPNMSTHILYLTNYNDFLPKEKVYQKN